MGAAGGRVRLVPVVLTELSSHWEGLAAAAVADHVAGLRAHSGVELRLTA
jgi:hypothetical protein